MNDFGLRRRMSKVEEATEKKQGHQTVLLWKDSQESEEQALARRSDIDLNDRSMELVFVQWLGEVEDTSTKPQE
jgi:hypothetical protein